MTSLLILFCLLNPPHNEPPTSIAVVGSTAVGSLPNTLQAHVGELLVLNADSDVPVTWDVPIGVPHHIDEAKRSLILPAFTPGTIIVSVWTVNDGKAVRAGRCTIVIQSLPKPEPEPKPDNLKAQLLAALKLDIEAGCGSKDQVQQLAEVFQLYATAMPEGLPSVGSFVTSLSAATPPQLRRHATLPTLHAAIGKYALAPILGSDASTPFDASIQKQTATTCQRIATLLKEVSQ